jgi:uncharacterized protein (DUF362 family)/NAD-dependent dihydropyrimidine dehydrogenase PreA subunit
MAAVIKEGDRVLIKVNLLSPKSPDKAVTTHPSVVKAVVNEVLASGGIPLVGDSSGGMLQGLSSTAKALSQSGIQEAAESAGAEIVNFDKDGVVRVENDGNPLADHFMMARITQEADLIINLPKLKTHSATLFTGAVKNMFGSIPGYQKAEYHRLAPNLTDFARILVDIYSHAKPALTIMDGIVSMEGNGPAHGHPKATGLLLASRDGVALDAVASGLIGFQPMQIDTTRIADQLGVGIGDLEKIDIQGIPFEEAAIKPFSLPSNAVLLKIPPFWLKRAMGFLSAHPDLVKGKCTGCSFCAENCPVQAIRMDEGFPRIDREKCILCYCCQELCPQGAMIVRHRSPLMRGYLKLRGKNR